jgi:hypothetical protein
MDHYMIKLGVREALAYLHTDPSEVVSDNDDGFFLDQIHSAIFKCAARDRIPWDRPSVGYLEHVRGALTWLSEEGLVETVDHGTEDLYLMDDTQLAKCMEDLCSDAGVNMEKLQHVLVDALGRLHSSNAGQSILGGYSMDQLQQELKHTYQYFVSKQVDKTIDGLKTLDFSQIIHTMLRFMGHGGLVNIEAGDTLYYSLSDEQLKEQRYKSMIQISKLKKVLCATILELHEGDPNLQKEYSAQTIYTSLSSSGAAASDFGIEDGSSEFEDIVGATLEELHAEEVIAKYFPTAPPRYSLTKMQKKRIELALQSADEIEARSESTKHAFGLMGGDIEAIKNEIENMNMGDLLALHQFVSNVVNRKVTELVALHGELGSTVAQLQRTLDSVSKGASRLN